MSFEKLVQTLALHVISNWKRSNSSSAEAKSTSFFVVNSTYLSFIKIQVPAIRGAPL